MYSYNPHQWENDYNPTTGSDIGEQGFSSEMKAPVRTHIYPDIEADPCKVLGTPVPQDEGVLGMIQEMIQETKEGAGYYTKLLGMVEVKDQKLMHDIRMDKWKQYKTLQELYYKVKGKKWEANAKEPKIMGNLAQEVEKSIFIELDTCFYLRRIYLSFMNLEFRDRLYDMICDSQENATKLTYLYAKVR